MSSRFRLSFFSVFILGFLLNFSGCVHHSGSVEIPVTPPESFSDSGTDFVIDEWWTVLGDDQLNSLIKLGLSENFSVLTAWNRLEQARATASKQSSGFWPSLDATAQGSRYVQDEGTRVYSSSYSLGISASYEVDLWGRVRSTASASALGFEAAREDLQSAAITLSSQIALAWIQMVQLHGELDILDQQIKTNQDYLDLISVRFKRGKSSISDVLQQRQLLESSMGERILVQSNCQILKNKLAVLTGQVPGTLEFECPTILPDLPLLPKTGIPLDLIRNRPDIKAAEYRVQSADWSVGAALAERFPRLSLTVSATSSAVEIRDLLDNWVATLLGNLLAPVFDAGKRKAEYERTQAVLEERVNAYGSTILNAFEEVENSLTRNRNQLKYVESLKLQLGYSKQATAQIRESFTKGKVDFTRYLTTLSAHQRLQRTVLKALAEQIEMRIELYRSLAGPISSIGDFK